MEGLSSAQMFLLRRKLVCFKALPVKLVQKPNTSFSAQISQVYVEDDFSLLSKLFLHKLVCPGPASVHKHFPKSPCTCCLVAGVTAEGHRKYFSWFAQLPCSVQFSLGSVCRLFPEQEGQNCIVKKRGKFAKISNEIDGQRNSTVAHLQSFFLILLQLR